MIFYRNPSPPSKRSCNMFMERPSLPLFLVEVLSIGASGKSVVIPEQAPRAKLWKEELNHILERLREERIGLRLLVSIKPQTETYVTWGVNVLY